MSSALDPYVRHGEDPDVINRLDAMIAEGAFGAVYRGCHTPTGAIVAIKIIQLDEQESFDDLLIEIEVMSRCHHENIISFFGCWIKNDELHVCHDIIHHITVVLCMKCIICDNEQIAMELCDGGAIADYYLELEQALAEDEIKLVCRDSLRGLLYMHQMGYLHRDIKGANILVKRDGSVKLIDFGVSGRVSPSMPTRQTFIGTPYWMAPEVIENKVSMSPYNGSCDVWSLGITMIELAEAGPPLADIHPMKALLQIPHRDPPKLKEPQKWTADFVSFVTCCLIKNPNERPTVEELLQHRWFQNMPDRSVLVTLTERFLTARTKHEEFEASLPMEEQNEEEIQARALLEKVQQDKGLQISPTDIHVMQDSPVLLDSSNSSSSSSSQGSSLTASPEPKPEPIEGSSMIMMTKPSPPGYPAGIRTMGPRPTVAASKQARDNVSKTINARSPIILASAAAANTSKPAASVADVHSPTNTGFASSGSSTPPGPFTPAYAGPSSPTYSSAGTSSPTYNNAGPSTPTYSYAPSTFTQFGQSDFQQGMQPVAQPMTQPSVQPTAQPINQPPSPTRVFNPVPGVPSSTAAFAPNPVNPAPQIMRPQNTSGGGSLVFLAGPSENKAVKPQVAASPIVQRHLTLTGANSSTVADQPQGFVPTAQQQQGGVPNFTPGSKRVNTVRSPLMKTGTPNSAITASTSAGLAAQPTGVRPSPSPVVPSSGMATMVTKPLPAVPVQPTPSVQQPMTSSPVQPVPYIPVQPMFGTQFQPVSTTTPVQPMSSMPAQPIPAAQPKPLPSLPVQQYSVAPSQPLPAASSQQSSLVMNSEVPRSPQQLPPVATATFPQEDPKVTAYRATLKGPTSRKERPKSVYHGTARRTAEINKMIDRRLLRGQLAEIKNLAKQQHKELDMLNMKIADQKTKLMKVISEKTAQETRKLQKIDEQMQKTASNQRDAESRRFKSDTESLQKQLQVQVREQQRSMAAQKKQLQKTFEEQKAEREKTFRESEKLNSKKGKDLPERIREAQAEERRVAHAQDEERHAQALEHRLAFLKMREEHNKMVRETVEQQKLMLSHSLQHLQSEKSILSEVHIKQIEIVHGSSQIYLREQLVREQQFEMNALKQIQALRKDQLERRFRLEADQQKRIQTVTMRDVMKELRASQKQKLDAFSNLQRSVMRTAMDKKQTKLEQREEKEEFMKLLREEEAKKQAQVRARLTEEDEALMESHAVQRKNLHEKHEKQICDLQKRQSEQLQAASTTASENVNAEIDELVTRQCMEQVSLLKRENEALATIFLQALSRIKEYREQCYREEIDLLTRQYEAAKAMCAQHKEQTMQMIHSRYMLQDSEAQNEQRQADLNMATREYDVACKHALARHKLNMDELTQFNATSVAEESSDAAAQLCNFRLVMTNYFTETKEQVTEALSRVHSTQQVVFPNMIIPDSPYGPFSTDGLNPAAQ